MLRSPAPRQLSQESAIRQSKNDGSENESHRTENRKAALHALNDCDRVDERHDDRKGYQRADKLPARHLTERFVVSGWRDVRHVRDVFSGLTIPS